MFSWIFLRNELAAEHGIEGIFPKTGKAGQLRMIDQSQRVQSVLGKRESERGKQWRTNNDNPSSLRIDRVLFYHLTKMTEFYNFSQNIQELASYQNLPYEVGETSPQRGKFNSKAALQGCSLLNWQSWSSLQGALGCESEELPTGMHPSRKGKASL